MRLIFGPLLWLDRNQIMYIEQCLETRENKIRRHTQLKFHDELHQIDDLILINPPVDLLDFLL